MHAMTHRPAETVPSYQRALEASKKARWDLESDVLRGRTLNTDHTFLPDGLSLAQSLPFLSAAEKRIFSQIQGRTYANFFGLVERFINAKVLQLSQRHFLGDQVALESLVRFSEEELKHQELFRRLEALAAREMPAGYAFHHDANAVALLVLTKSTWSVLALTCHIELFTLAHYKESIAAEDSLSPLWKDAFLYHWKEESQHAVIDELEWRQADRVIGDVQRDAAVDDFIALVGAVDGMLQAQAAEDSRYFQARMGRVLTPDERSAVSAVFLKAYRYQYVFSGLERTRFPAVLAELTSAAQRARIDAALATLA